MKLLSAPRQPFVGLALMAALGIIAAESIPLPSVAVTAAVIILALCILTVAVWPRLLMTYAIVGAGFFLLHNFQTKNTEGQQLADELGGRSRVVTAIGCVISEPKTAPSGFATFLLELKSIHARRLAGPLERRAGIWGRIRAFWNCRADTAAAKSRRIRYAFLSRAPRCSSDALRSLSGKRHADSTRRWQPNHARSAEVAHLDAGQTLPGTGGRA